MEARQVGDSKQNLSDILLKILDSQKSNDELTQMGNELSKFATLQMIESAS